MAGRVRPRPKNDSPASNTTPTPLPRIQVAGKFLARVTFPSVGQAHNLNIISHFHILFWIWIICFILETLFFMIIVPEWRREKEIPESSYGTRGILMIVFLVFGPHLILFLKSLLLPLALSYSIFLFHPTTDDEMVRFACYSVRKTKLITILSIGIAVFRIVPFYEGIFENKGTAHIITIGLAMICLVAIAFTVYRFKKYKTVNVKELLVVLQISVVVVVELTKILSILALQLLHIQPPETFDLVNHAHFAYLSVPFVIYGLSLTKYGKLITDKKVCPYEIETNEN